MIKRLTYMMLSLAFIPLALGWVTYPVQASVEVGTTAPDFTATNIIDGTTFKLSEQKGKIVVVEWTNPECPFVVKHYGSNNMQKLQQAAKDKGVIWVSVNSSAPEKQGNLTAEAAQAIVKEKGIQSAAYILDPTGEIGKLYGAKTTPHMFVVSAEGNLAYAGAIDSNPDPKPESIDGATNYVTAAIDELLAGKPVTTASTPSYGCSVKY